MNRLKEQAYSFWMLLTSNLKMNILLPWSVDDQKVAAILSVFDVELATDKDVNL